MDLSKIEELNLESGKTKFYKKDVLDLYYKVLCNSNRWDLGLGYFSLSSLRLLAYPLARFIIYNNGKIRLYCNEKFSEEDFQILSNNPESIYDVSLFTKSLISFYEALVGVDKELFANCVAYLINKRLIEIKVLISRSSSRGISHTKNSIFKDDTGNVVLLSGSANASEQAFLFNREDTTAFCSFWNERSSNKSIQLTVEEFESTFKNGDDEWEIVELDSSALEKRIQENGYRESPSIDKLKKLCFEYVDKSKLPFSEKINEEIKQYLDDHQIGLSSRASDILVQYNLREKFNFPCQNLRRYQKISIEKWIRNGKKGILAMATGTGKTFSAFGAIMEILKETNFIIFICCPYQHLVEQWAMQIKGFGVTPVIVHGDSNWKKILPLKLRGYNSQSSPLFVVATNNSLQSTSPFSKLMKNYWKSTLFISDEAHSLGSGNLRNCLPEESTARLALSATIDRYFDDSGTEALKQYFKGVVYELSLKDAIGKYLVKYYYHPIPVELEEEKFEKFIKLSNEISRLGNFDDPESEDRSLKLMLLRSRLSNNCRNKLEWLDNNIESNKSLKNTLFYVGDEIFEDTTKLLSQNKNIVATQFYGKTSNKERQEILTQFSKGIIDCLVAMKCLDEGVDVPATKLAYFLASSGNPKEFVQRRGRVLRKSPGKEFAIIYDLISVPPSYVDKKHRHYKISKSLLISEFKRIREFAGLATNQYASLKALKPIIDKFELYNQIG